MSFKAKLIVDDKEFNIMTYHLSLHQPTDYTGRPCAKPQGGIWNITLETTKDTLFHEWAMHPTLMKNVKIALSSITINGKSRVFKLYDVHCVKDMTHFNAMGNNPVLNHLTLSPGIILVDGVEFEKSWKVTNLENDSGNQQENKKQNKNLKVNANLS